MEKKNSRIKILAAAVFTSGEVNVELVTEPEPPASASQMANRPPLREMVYLV